MIDQQLDANKVIESLLRQIAEQAHKIALLEAYIGQDDKPAQEQVE